MKGKATPYIYIPFLFLLWGPLFAQTHELRIECKDKEEQEVVESMGYGRIHRELSGAYAELDSLDGRLERMGYLIAMRLQTRETDSTLTALYELGQRTESIRLIVEENTRTAEPGPGIFAELDPKHKLNEKNELTLPFEELTGYLQGLADRLEASGRSFSEVRLSEISIDDGIAKAHLILTESSKRTIDKIVIKGYENFPEKFVRRELGLASGSEFNRSRLERASRALASIPFAEETRPPEVLFTSDSTLVYLYIQKKRSNRFDGIIGFASKEESSGLEFNGYLDLELNNIFNGGETIALYWKNNGEDRQRFYLQAEIPFLLNTPLTPRLNFELYRQDSTFSNVTASLDLSYRINLKSQASLSLRTENSNDLDSGGSLTIQSYSNFFAGGGYSLREPADDPIFINRYRLEAEALIGSRQTDDESVSQTRFGLSASYLWALDGRNHIFVQNQSGLLNSSDYLENELFRIGGIYNLRGVNEESLFASAFSVFNLEYRYKPTASSYFYTISDFALVENQVVGESTTIISFGLGYAFRTRAGIINLSYANGKFENSPFSFENSKVHVKIVSYF